MFMTNSWWLFYGECETFLNFRYAGASPTKQGIADGQHVKTLPIHHSIVYYLLHIGPDIRLQ